MLSWPVKDPQDRLDYTLQWHLRLPAGDQLITSSWFSNSDSPGLVIDTNTFDATSALVWLMGGVAGTTYIVTNHVTTSGGRVMEFSVKLKVKER